jgi:hypothetical protein
VKQFEVASLIIFGLVPTLLNVHRANLVENTDSLKNLKLMQQEDLKPSNKGNSTTDENEKANGSNSPSLDKVRNNWTFSESTPEERTLCNNRFSAKISSKAKESKNIRVQIRAFLADNCGIVLPVQYNDYKHQKDELLEGFEEFEELAKSVYKIAPPIGVYAIFDDGKEQKSQMIGAKYSRHRLDPVWIYRKSQLIRKTWREYLNETKIHREFRPCHLVLTVPHKNGEFAESEFYAKELVKCFNQLRKRVVWKDSIKGGEYGVEVKKSKKNGLHIHIHSLCFIEWNTNLKILREDLKKAWKRVCKVPPEDHIMLHLETLYFFDSEMETYKAVSGVEEKLDEFGEFEYSEIKEEKQRRKKVYLERNSPDEDYLRGVMECIKYHFKMDDLYVSDSEGNVLKNGGGFPIVDVILVNDILMNSKGLRFYSKFGICYGEDLLNYDKKVEAEETDEEAAEVEMGDLDKMANNLVNPLTLSESSGNDFSIQIAHCSEVKHNPKSDEYFPLEPKIRGLGGFFECSQQLSPKEIMRYLATNKVKEVLSYEGFQAFNDSFGFDSIREEYLANVININPKKS